MFHSNRTGWVVRVAFLLLILLTVGAAYGQAEPGTLRNPLNNSGPDPWLTYYEGNYYLTTTTGASFWTMLKSPTLAGLKTAAPVQIYAETDSSRCCNFWAPEFHLLEGPDGLRWYYYYSAGTAGTFDNQRTHVLESAGSDPMGPYTYKGRLFDAANDGWAIDGSVMQLDGALYFLFSSWVGPNQSMFIAPMSNPWTLSGRRVLIAEPEYSWEQAGLNVNEGPVALQHDGKTFIIYSASFCGTPDYKLGMLTYNGGDPLQTSSWVKNPQPVFERSDANGVYGPGHNGFFKSPDGTEDWIVYHANDGADFGCLGRRTTRVQKFTWNADGTPNFGVPVAKDEVMAAPSGDTGVDRALEMLSQEIVTFKTLAQPTAYLSVVDFQLTLNFNRDANALFVTVPGLAEADAVSIESVNYPGFFLRHQNNVISLSANDNSETFAGEATWWLRPGLADGSALSLEAYSQSGYYIGKQFGILALVALTDASPERAREDATFVQEGE